MSSRKCHICGGRINKKIENINLNIPEKFRLKSTYNIVRCEKCGFCFSDTESTNDDFEYYYKNFNIYTYENVDKDIESYYNNLSKRIVDKYICKESNILNIGIGRGELEKYFYTLGYKNIFAIDPSSESVNKLLESGIKCAVGSIYDEPKNEYVGKFDVVFLRNTLEHLFNIEKAIENLIKYVKKETGVIVISVPDYGVMQNNTTNIPNNFNQEHINYFSRISLRNLLARFKYKEIYTQSTIAEHDNKQEFGIYSVFKFEEQIENVYLKDEMTGKAIEAYFDIHKHSDSQVIINKLIYNKEEIVIWGTGAYTMSLLANNNLNKCNIVAFVDNNPLKENTFFNGLTIRKPDKKLLDGKKIIICSMLYASDIKSQIEDMNINCDIVIL